MERILKNTQHACALAAVLLLYSVTASADAPKLKPADCEAVRGFSQDLMMGRQSGFKMEGMMKGIPAGEQHNPMRQMVKEAYEEPQYKTRADQERAALSFSYTQYARCIQRVVEQIEVPKASK